LKAYEGAIIYFPQLAGDQIKQAKDEFSELVKKLGGKMISAVEQGTRTLGYKVKKNSQGFIIIYDFELPTDQATSFRRTLQLSENILKFNIYVKRVSKPKGKNPVPNQQTVAATK